MSATLETVTGGTRYFLEFPMIRTPYFHQSAPELVPGQIVNPVQVVEARMVSLAQYIAAVQQQAAAHAKAAA